MIYNATPTYIIKASVDKSDGIMVALRVPADAAKALALEGGQPASDLHITLVYLGKKSDFPQGKMQVLHDIVGDIARTTAPVDIALNGYGVFEETDDGPCLYAKVQPTSGLLALRETVVEAVSSYGMPPKGRGAEGEYIPHITLAYRESAEPPDIMIPGFRAEWLRATFGGTEALMKLQETGMKKKDAGAANVASVNPIDVGGMGSYKPKKPGVNPFESLLQPIEALRKSIEQMVKEFNEADHPRASDGRFGSQAGEHGGAKKPEGEEEEKDPEARGGWGGVNAVEQNDVEQAYQRMRVKELQADPAWGDKPVEALNNFVKDEWDQKSDAEKLEMHGRMFPAPTNEGPIGGPPKVGDTLPGGGKIQPGDLEEPAPAKPGEKLFGGENIDKYKDWNRVPEKWRAVAQNQFEQEWPGWARQHGPEEFRNAPDENLQLIARSRWDGMTDADKLNYAQNQVAKPDLPDLARRDFNVSDPRFWGDEPGGPKDQPADVASAPAKVPEKWDDLNPNQQNAGRKAFVDDFAANNGGGTLAQERGYHLWEKMTPEDRVVWAKEAEARGEKVTPEPGDAAEPIEPTRGDSELANRPTHPDYWEGKPADAPIPAPAPVADPEDNAARREWENAQEVSEPEEEDPQPSHFTPDEWGMLDEDKQREVMQAWKNDVRDEWVQGEVDNWIENFDERGGDGDQVREEMEKDESEAHGFLKDQHVYPGEETTNQEAAAQVWAKKVGFSMERAIENGAFAWDEDGDLTVDADLIGFTANPYEGAEAEAQQMIPGVDRAELAKAWNERTWAEVSDDVEKTFKEDYQKELERRMDKAKENPPDWIGEQADEQLEEFWDQKEDREKFREAQRLLSDSDLRIDNPDFEGHREPRADGISRPQGDGKKGTVAPSSQDAREMKAIQAKFPKGNTTANIEKQKYNGEGISDSYNVTMKDGSKYIWKPSTGEAGTRKTGRNGIHSGVQYVNEVAAYEIAKIGGMADVVPPSAIVEHENEFGVMQHFRPDADNDGRGNGNSDELAQRATVFDLIIGNTDRHGKNWITDGNGKRWLIDHGLSFSTTEEYGRWGIGSKAGLDDSTESIDDKYIKPWRGKWDQIEAVLKHRQYSDKQIELTKKRYDHAMQADTWKELMEGMDS